MVDVDHKIDRQWNLTLTMIYLVPMDSLDRTRLEVLVVVVISHNLHETFT